MTRLVSGEGNTPLTPDEEAELIPNLATKEELNEWERLNILAAHRWATSPARIHRRNPLDEAYVREFHRRMFDQTWKWAGRYRVTEKNLGIQAHRIQEALAALLGDARYWLDRKTYPPDEIAIRFHHRLVVIHPFSNGNGRHARLMADLLAMRQGREPFSWGAGELAKAGDFRRSYIESLKAADRGDVRPLLAFART